MLKIDDLTSYKRRCQNVSESGTGSRWRQWMHRWEMAQVEYQGIPLSSRQEDWGASPI